MGIKNFKSQINDQTWLDWLSNDPPAAAAHAELREKKIKQANQYTPRALHQPPVAPGTAQQPTPPAAGVSIQINIPQIKKPQFVRSKAAWEWVRANTTKKHIIIGSIVAAVILVSWIGAVVTQHKLTARSGEAAASHSGGAVTSGIIKPDFTPVVPSTKISLATPDNTHSRYDATKETYSFIDDIGGKQFTVSQQRLTTAADAQKNAAKAAKSLNATVNLKTGWGTAYLLTNQKYNSQTLTFSIHDRLMFIQSSFVFTNDQLTGYINNLQ